MIIDAHHHVWDPAKRDYRWLGSAPPSLRRRFDLSDFEAVANPQGVRASVLVQAVASSEETEELLGLASRSEVVAGVVGWVDLVSDGVVTELERLRGVPGGDRLVGVRYVIQDEMDRHRLEHPRVLVGLRAVAEARLALDLLVRPSRLAFALVAADALEGWPVVLDHGGKPEISAGLWEPWSTLVGELAARPHVLCKLSGLVTEAGAGWTETVVAPYVDRLLSCFGPQRLIFGSDWPVCTAVASYADVSELARSLLSRHLAGEELVGVFTSNAAQAYGLDLRDR